MRITTKQIIIEWLKTIQPTMITYSNIERELPAFGQHMYGIYHNASNYTKRFRELNADQSMYRANNIVIEEVKEKSDQIHKTWFVKSGG